MSIIIVSIHVAAAVILVLTVLLQAGKGAGMGAAFGGASGTVFGTRGPATLISKITCGAAVVFMCTSLNLALSQSGAGKGSVMDEWSGGPAAPVSAPAQATPAAPEAQATPAPLEAQATPAPPAVETEATITGPEAAQPPAAAGETMAPPDEAATGQPE